MTDPIGIATHDNYDIVDVLTEPIYEFDTTEEIPAVDTTKVVYNDLDVTFYRDTPDSAYYGELHYKDGFYYAVRFGQNFMCPLLKDGAQVETIPEIEDQWVPPDKRPFDVIGWIQEHPQEVAIYGGLGALGVILISR